jgi:hypothetical protein
MNLTHSQVSVKRLLDHLAPILDKALQTHIFETPMRPFLVFRVGKTVVSMWHIGEGVYDVTITDCSRACIDDTG